MLDDVQKESDELQQVKPVLFAFVDFINRFDLVAVKHVCDLFCIKLVHEGLSTRVRASVGAWCEVHYFLYHLLRCPLSG